MSSGRKHWFRVADSILYEGWSNDELATFIRLCAHLNTRWAREGRFTRDAGTSLLDPADVLKITGRARLDVGLSSLRALAEHASISVETHGKLTKISVSNWAKFQHLKPDSGEESARIAPPPQDARRKTQDAPARRNPEQEAPASAPPPPPPAMVRKSTKIPKPSSFTGEARERIQTWAAGHGYDRAVLNAGLERFREWEPLKTQNRTIAQWVGAFMRIVREGVEDGKIASKSASTGASRYRDAEDVLAEKRRKAAEDDARARERDSEGERVGKVIDLALRQAGGAAG